MPEGVSLIGSVLFLARRGWRRVIGADHDDHAPGAPPPTRPGDTSRMKWVHLGIVGEALVTTPRRRMLYGDVAGGSAVAMSSAAASSGISSPSRDMSIYAGGRPGAPGAKPVRWTCAPIPRRARPDVVLDARVRRGALPRDHAVFVFGMDRDPAPGLAFMLARTAFFLGGAEACRWMKPVKGLDAAHARQFFQLGQGADILRRGAGIKGMVAIHAEPLAWASLSSTPRRGLVSGRIGVRHFEHGRDPAQDGGQASAFPGLHYGRWAPGSRKRTWASITLGRTCRPLASNTSAALASGKGSRWR